MAGRITFSMIKPEALADGHAGAILAKIEEAGFKIKAIKMTSLSYERAGQFYAVHEGKPFYETLRKNMSAGPLIALVLEGDDAILSFRKLIGTTNPANAEEGTIRKLYARTTEQNGVHGSDSDENALLEASFYFSQMEIY